MKDRILKCKDGTIRIPGWVNQVQRSSVYKRLSGNHTKKAFRELFEQFTDLLNEQGILIVSTPYTMPFGIRCWHNFTMKEDSEHRGWIYSLYTSEGYVDCVRLDIDIKLLPNEGDEYELTVNLFGPKNRHAKRNTVDEQIGYGRCGQQVTW